jgi:outer membrane immunogenic protein
VYSSLRLRTLSLAVVVLAAVPLVLSVGSAHSKPLNKDRAQAVVAPDSFSWTGFYIGGHVGEGWSSGWNGTANPLPSPAAFGALPLSFTQSASGLIAGGQIGYNWQFAPNWMLGIETDLSKAHINTVSVTPALNLAGAPFVGDADCPGTQVCTSFLGRDLHLLGTVRARAGFVWDHLLVYITGGFAYGRIGYRANYNVCCQHPSSFTDTKTGGTIGGGLEYALPGTLGNWTIKGEYLYVELASANDTVQQMSPPDPTYHMRYDWNRTKIQIGRFGLNYKFN